MALHELIAVLKQEVIYVSLQFYICVNLDHQHLILGASQNQVHALFNKTNWN